MCEIDTANVLRPFLNAVNVWDKSYLEIACNRVLSLYDLSTFLGWERKFFACVQAILYHDLVLA